MSTGLAAGLRRVRPALAVAVLACGCEFPSAYRCGPDAPCAAGARCDPRTHVCSADDARLPDAAAPDAAPATDAAQTAADSAPPDAGCDAVCPQTGSCSAELPVVDPSFETGAPAWELSAPAALVEVALDGRGPQAGERMAELRLDTERVDDRNYTRLTQLLPVDALAPGRYRLCFQRRIVTSMDSCPTTKHPEFVAMLMGRDPAPGATEPLVHGLWQETEATYCDELRVESFKRVSDWRELCAEVTLTEELLSPSLFFQVRIDSFLTPRWFHTVLLDAVVLAAADCLVPD